MFHLVPNAEIQQHEISPQCSCEPDHVLKGRSFWLGRFIGFELYQHQRLSPKTDERLCAVGEGVQA